MDEHMTKDELVAMLTRHFDSLWRIKQAMPDGVENSILERELAVLEIQLHALGIPTETLKR